jgi:hypothetical protein
MGVSANLSISMGSIVIALLIVHTSARYVSKVASRLAIVVSTLAVMAPSAHGQTDEARAAARVAATEGLRALNEGRYKDAVDLCTRAESLMHAPTHLLLIARAQTKLGHLVEAQEAYIKIQRDRLAPNAPHAFVDAQAAANDEETALAPRVPTLKVSVEGDGASDAQVTLDGAPFPSALIGLASPIDPGSHVLQARSASSAADPFTVTVAEGAKQSVTLTMKPVAAAEPVATLPATPEPAADEASSGHPGLRVAGWIGVGLGVAGLAVGSILVIKNHSDRNDANALCGPAGCPDSKRSQIEAFDDEANSAATLSWVSFGVGAAGLVTGATLLWLGHDRKAAAPQSGEVTPWFSKRAVGVRVTF